MCLPFGGVTVDFALTLLVFLWTLLALEREHDSVPSLWLSAESTCKVLSRERDGVDMVCIREFDFNVWVHI